LCSESTAFSSRTVPDGANNGEWKKPEKRSRAPAKADVATLKKKLVFVGAVNAFDEPLFLERNCESRQMDLAISEMVYL
jgi:hypothetical protein